MASTPAFRLVAYTLILTKDVTVDSLAIWKRSPLSLKALFS
jgi:hypothetical protein